ncbi:hypothetical protein CW304_17165 [Bacillus sp. UFRGS-B20]|nr:hypothetical protein CW304_17165 [Bacillus sp. UFRGS-B20]
MFPGAYWSKAPQVIFVIKNRYNPFNNGVKCGHRFLPDRLQLRLYSKDLVKFCQWGCASYSAGVSLKKRRGLCARHAGSLVSDRFFR